MAKPLIASVNDAVLKYFCLALIFFASFCSSPSEPAKSTPPKVRSEDPIKEAPKEDQKEESAGNVSTNEALEKTENTLISSSSSYSWLDQSPEANTISQRIPPPSGFTRKAVSAGSFAEWLRHLPLKAEGSPVYLYDGRLKGNQNAHFAVLDIDPGKRDLQQCADAVMRLKAEYHFGRKEYDKIHFNYTSGDRVSFSDWAIGRKPIINGNQVRFSAAGSHKDYSYSNFRKYLIQIFSYAGTASLSKELKKVKLEELSIGDVFIWGGFPGHAVIVVDQVENEEGEKRFMLAQSYMPAQEIHILLNPAANDTPWYHPDFGNTLETPEWSFSSDELKRFPY